MYNLEIKDEDNNIFIWENFLQMDNLLKYAFEWLQRETCSAEEGQFAMDCQCQEVDDEDSETETKIIKCHICKIMEGDIVPDQSTLEQLFVDIFQHDLHNGGHGYIIDIMPIKFQEVADDLQDTFNNIVKQAVKRTERLAIFT